MHDGESINFDLTDLASFRQGHPFAEHDRIRQTHPVYRNPVDDRSHTVWLLTRHGDIETVARNNANFTSMQGFRIQERGGGIALLKSHIRGAVSSTLLTMDPPRHLEVRRPMQGHFLPCALQRLDAQIDGFVDAMVSALPDNSEIEFVNSCKRGSSFFVWPRHPPLPWRPDCQHAIRRAPARAAPTISRHGGSRGTRLLAVQFCLRD